MFKILLRPWELASQHLEQCLAILTSAGFSVEVKPLTRAWAETDTLLYDLEPIHGRTHLVVTDQDLWVRGLGFVFGYAHLIRKVAAVSTHRMQESFYHRIEDVALQAARFRKCLLHEVGHTLGLRHCSEICVMATACDIAEVDELATQFCQTCSAQADLVYRMRMIEEMSQ